jgi:glycosyltransferase involved in cell wall biosynthesis
VKIAVCEADTPTPTRDAGSRAVVDLVAGLQTLGHDVRLFVEAAQRLPERVGEFAPAAIVISRPGLFARLEPQLRPLGVPLVYLAHDLHFVRVGLQQQFSTRPDAAVGQVMRIVEQRCFEAADLSLVPTEAEADRVREEFPDARCLAINYFSMPVRVARAVPPRNRRIAFVGSYRHAPNADGMSWFVREVWPEVRGRHPSSEVVVAGVWLPDDPVFAAPGVRAAGELTDAELDELLADSWTGVAPLRFGAGVKRKTLHYLSLGLPTIGTSFAVEGLATGPSYDVPGLLSATSETEWIDAFDLLDDPSRWLELAASATHFVSESYSASRYLDGLAKFLSLLG